MVAYLARETLGESSPGMALARVTSNVQLLDAGVRAAIGTTTAALDLYARRSRARPATP
jgi:hypothetical protein